MKKFTLAITLLTCAGFAANAQITITQTNLPTIGNQFVIVTDGSNSIKVPGGTGASQTWNFGSLTATNPDTATVVATSSTPSIYSSLFPSANLAVSYSNKGANEAEYEYFNSSATTFALNGLIFNSSFYGNIAYKYSPAYSFINGLPVTYKSHWNGTYKAVFKTAYAGSGYDSIEEVEMGTYRDSIDSWGNVTTPSGTFNSIRNKHLETDLDSTYIHLTSTHMWTSIGVSTSTDNYYAWYSNAAGINYYVAEMQVDAGDSVTSVSWLDTKPLGMQQITNADNGNTTAYPNPTSTQLTIQTTATETGMVKIYDVAGKAIETISFDNNKALVNTSHYANGIYLYMVTDKQGNVLAKNKFVVVK